MSKLTFGFYEQEKLLTQYENSKEDPKNWDLHNLEKTASQAGEQGERAREILRDRGLRR